MPTQWEKTSIKDIQVLVDREFFILMEIRCSMIRRSDIGTPSALIVGNFGFAGFFLVSTSSWFKAILAICKQHVTGSTAHRLQAIGHKLQATGHRLQSTGHRSQASCYRPQVTVHKPSATGHRPQTTGHRSRAICCIPTGVAKQLVTKLNKK